MKNLLIMPLLVFLAGCVTYYYPETAFEDGVYYAEDDPAYTYNSADYSGVVYYPWSSLDYFYMGYWPYPGYGFVYGYPFGPGYSPWHYPNGFYGYYSPWYNPYYYGYYWQPYRGYCVRASACNRRHPGNRYAAYYPATHHNRGREDEEGAGYSPGEDETIDRNSVSSTRYVTTAPPGYSGNQGMVIRSNEGSKVGKNQLEPVKPARTKPVSARYPATGSVSRPSATPSVNTRTPRSSVVSRPSSRFSSGKSKASSRRDRD